MIQFDADSIKERIKTRLQAKESWKNILFFSTNQRLIDIFAEELAYDMQYDEMLTTECKWNIAQQKTSLMAETKFFNYYPHRKIGSSGNLRVSTSKTFNTTYGVTISIPKYSVFKSSSGLSFSCTETTDLPIYDAYIDIPITQGIPMSETFTAIGDVYETFYIYNDSIENSVIDVYVNGTKWIKVDSIREAENIDSLNYVVTTLNDFSGISIKFGNDYFGKKLVEGDVVLVKYLETSGSNGNVDSSNIITKVSSTFYDINTDPVTLYCTNLVAISGGLDYEDIETIRDKAPATYATGDRAISKYDYKEIIESFSFVKKAIVWGEAEYNEDAGNLPGTYVPVEENVVHVAVVSESDADLTNDEELEIRTELNNKKPPTDLVVFSDVIFTYIVFSVQAYVSDTNYALSTVKASIESTLENTYSLSSMNFFTPIRFSDYVALIDDVSGVDYHDTTVSYFILSKFNSSYEGGIAIAMSNIEEGSVKIYARNSTVVGSSFFQIGYDDGSGNLLGYGSYTFSASTINYNTGEGNLIVISGLTEDYTSYIIKTEYSTTITNIIPTERNQIVSYGGSTVVAEYE